MIYFDNAATSFPKPRIVLREINKCVRYYCGNPGRSGHFLAIKSSEKVYEARENIAKLFKYNNPERIVFCQNATHGLNIAIKGLVNKNTSVIISDLEHNSVIRPLYKALGKSGDISVFDSDLNLYKAIVPLIKEDTKVLISTLSSNVTGKVLDPYILSDIARKYNLSLILDASQYAGHLPLDLSKCKCDALIAPGHKSLFGLQGSGFIIMCTDKTYDTIIEGGNGLDTLNTEMPELLPERFEAGTLAVPSIVGLSKGIEFILERGEITIKEKLEDLTSKAFDILSNIPNIKIYGAENGIISFCQNNVPSSVTSNILSSSGIASRSGLHCAPLIHRKMGTLDNGLVRLSFSYFNNRRQLDKLYKALKYN